MRLAVIRASASSEAARRHGRAAQADAARDHGLFGIVRDAVLVAGDVRLPEHGFRCLAGHALGPQIDQHHVAFGAAGDDAQTALRQLVGQRCRILQNLLLVQP